MLDDRTLALLGDQAAQERITERGELLPCPFCGGEADEKDNWIFCIDCGVGYEEFDPEESKKAWNTRATILTETQLSLLEIAENPRKFSGGTDGKENP